MGYQRGCEETAKAYGGCELCYGKGYSTQLIRENDSVESKTIMNYCTCERGEQLCFQFASLSMPCVGEICGVSLHVDTKDMLKIKEVMEALDTKFDE